MFNSIFKSLDETSHANTHKEVNDKSRRQTFRNIDPKQQIDCTGKMKTWYHNNALKNPDSTEKMDLFIVVPINVENFLSSLAVLENNTIPETIKNFNPFEMMPSILNTNYAGYLILFDNKKNAQTRTNISGEPCSFGYEQHAINHNANDYSEDFFDNKHLPYKFIIYCVECSPNKLRGLLRENDFASIQECTKYCMHPKREDTGNKTLLELKLNYYGKSRSTSPLINISFLYPTLDPNKSACDEQWVRYGCRSSLNYNNKHLVLLINLSRLYDNDLFGHEPKEGDKPLWTKYEGLRKGFKILSYELIFKIQTFLGGDIPREVKENRVILKSIRKHRKEIRQSLKNRKVKSITFFVYKDDDENQGRCDIKIEEEKRGCTIS